MDQFRQTDQFYSLRPGKLTLRLEWSATYTTRKDPDGGGIADRPGDMVDVFHTHFGVAGKHHPELTGFVLHEYISLAGLSLLGYPGLEDLDPVYCMPAKVIEILGLRKGWKALTRRRPSTHSK